LTGQAKGKRTTPTEALMLPFLDFADQHNMAVLTWGTVDAWNNTVNTEEMAHREQEEFDRNFDLLADAWGRGVAQLGQETGIPQKDYLLYGISRGAQWAHRLALRKPDYFLAVHIHIPSTFDTPTATGNQTLWLVTTGEQEYGYERAQQFYHECRALGYPIIFKAIIGLGHADSSIEHALGFKFFEYALSVRAARDSWLEAMNNPFRSRLSQSWPPETWLAAFRAPPFYGDFLNQDCYPANQIDMIPVVLRVPLPTKELAELWNK
jgi:pimeloyl-ACP methyl ester carboxylesterase